MNPRFGLGFDVHPAHGTYFCCAGFSRFHGGDDAAFCRWLTAEIGVAALPPSSFYGKSEEGKQFARFAFGDQLPYSARYLLLQLPGGFGVLGCGQLKSRRLL